MLISVEKLKKKYTLNVSNNVRIVSIICYVLLIVAFKI